MPDVAETAGSILVVEDDEGTSSLVRMMAEGQRLSASAAFNLAEGYAYLDEHGAPDLVVLDLALPDGDGMDFLARLRALGARSGVILVSGFGSKVLGTVRRLGEEGGLSIVGAIEKPFEAERLRKLLASGVDKSRPIGREDLRHAIESGQIGVFYQPKVDLRRARFADRPSVEALARWRHPELGWIPPASFIPLAEQSGLIGTLTEAVARIALRQVRGWRGAGIRMTAACNLSPMLLEDPDLPEKLAEIAREEETGLDHLALEVTETAAMEASENLMRIATRLRLKGTGLSLDDFGTGYSSMRQLYRLPFNELKIDRSFVTDLAADDEAQAIVKASIDLAHALGMSVCAEGVENLDALEVLQHFGCDLAQGFFMSRPVPPGQLESFLRGWGNPLSEAARGR